MLIRYIANTFEIEDRKFTVLGDDVVICDDTLAEKYLRTLKSLEIPVNLSKTFQSHDWLEFAKRLVWKGIEVSPFPLHAIHESKGSPSGLFEAFRTACVKGWLRDVNWTGPALITVINKIHKLHPDFSRKVRENYVDYALTPKSFMTVEEMS